MADALKARGNHVEQKAAHELIGGERHRPPALRIGGAVVLVLESHLLVLKGQQTLITQGDPVGVASEVFDDLFGLACRARCACQASGLARPASR